MTIVDVEIKSDIIIDYPQTICKYLMRYIFKRGLDVLLCGLQETTKITSTHSMKSPILEFAREKIYFV